MWCLSHLPYRWLMSIGRALGRLMGRLGTERKHIARVNLSLCLPELKDAAREQLLARHLEAVGMAIMETDISWWMPTDRLRPLVQVEGVEHLNTA